jgi:DNA-binding MarR family transcriptional regulator
MTARPIRPAELVRRTQQALAALYEASAPSEDLTLPQFAVLDALKRHGPQTGAAMITLTGIDRTTLFGLVDRLRSAGMLVTVKIESEKPGPRPLRCSLTPKALRALAKAETAVWNAEVKLMSTLTPQERATFLNALAVTAFAGPRP